jgi:replicative DNA helicase
MRGAWGGKGEGVRKPMPLLDSTMIVMVSRPGAGIVRFAFTVVYKASKSDGMPAGVGAGVFCAV